jgi:hypothetical protein
MVETSAVAMPDPVRSGAGQVNRTHALAGSMAIASFYFPNRVRPAFAGMPKVVIRTRSQPLSFFRTRDNQRNPKLSEEARRQRRQQLHAQQQLLDALKLAADSEAQQYD